MKILLIALVIVSTLGLASCQSSATQERFTLAQTNVTSCQAQVLTMRATPKAVPQFKSETNMLLYLVVQELADSKKGDDMIACASPYIAMIKADSMKTSNLINRGFGLAGIGMGLWGAAIITDGIVDLAGQGSSTFNARDINVTNTAGTGGLETPGGSASMNTVLGGGSIQTLEGGSQINTAEKQIVSPITDGGGSNILDDSGDGSDNEAGLF